MLKDREKATILYKGYFPNGDVFDDGTNTPFEITIGRHQIMPVLEKAISGLEINEESTLEIKAKDAYGEYDEEAVQRVPTYKIPNGQNIPEGEIIGWTSPRNTKPIPVKVVKIENQVATLDFNHPLAGKDIVYWVKRIK
jgi:peptidylprolyl isomerase